MVNVTAPKFLVSCVPMVLQSQQAIATEWLFWQAHSEAHSGVAGVGEFVEFSTEPWRS